MTDTEIIAPHFKRRLSGVTSTVVQLIPKQVSQGCRIATLGPGLPDHLPKLGWAQLLQAWKRLPDGRPRVWHARRNNEMLAGVILRDVLRMPLKLVFTSAAQRNHTGFTKGLIRRMDAVIATSARSASFLKVPHRVISHGVDLDLFRPAENNVKLMPDGFPGRYLVGCFGRIRPSKGTDLFVQAMIALLPDHPDWTAVICGRAVEKFQPFENELKAAVEKAGLTDRIRFLGEVPDIKPWYQRLSLYVAPSRNEGFGLTPLEAMASGTPVVASDAGAYAEMIIQGETGLVVPADHGAALTAAIRTYFDDPIMTASQSISARQHVERSYGLEREVAGIGRVYDDVRSGQ